MSVTTDPIFANFNACYLSSRGVAIRYVLPVSWMTSRLHIMPCRIQRHEKDVRLAPQVAEAGAESAVYECLGDSRDAGGSVAISLAHLTYLKYSVNIHRTRQKIPVYHTIRYDILF